MTRAALLLLASGLAQGAWIELRPPGGPVIVLTDAGDKDGRIALNHVEQFRAALGGAVGQPELRSSWPIVIVVQKSPSAQVLGLGRAHLMGTWKAGSVPPPGWWRQLGAQFLESSLPGRMPPGMEEALLSFYSTLGVQRTHLTIGIPPSQPERTVEWALIHMLATRAETASRVRILTANLAQGAEEDSAYFNSFGTRKAELMEKARAYLAAGKFESAEVSGKVLDQDHFKEIPASPTQVKLIPGDLLLAQRAAPAAIRAAYQSAVTQGALAGGHEGLGLVALLENDRETALKELQAAVAVEGAGPRAWLELGRLTKNAAEARKCFEQALVLNPAWAEPHVRISERVETANMRGFALQKAAAAEPRNKGLAVAAAQALEEAGRFEDAVKMWRLAERAAANQAEKDDLLRLQRESEERRQAAAADERRRKAEAEKAELDRLRNESLARIKEAENKANQAAGPVQSVRREKWWDAPEGTKVSGTFERLECTGTRARMVLRGADGKPIMLSIPDPSKVVIAGGGEKTFGCGVQKPPRKVNVEYTPKPDAKLGTAGEVSLIEFQ